MARKSENGFRALLPVHRFQRSNMNLIDKKEAINRLRYEKPNMQICFRTEDALKKLHFRHALHE